MNKTLNFMVFITQNDLEKVQNKAYKWIWEMQIVNICWSSHVVYLFIYSYVNK